MDRREFAALLPALLAASTLEGAAQTQPSSAPDQTASAALKTLTSGTFHPGQASSAPDGKRTSHRFLLGMLPAGNIRLEMHETVQQPGAEHEPVGTHKHSEIWLMQRGVASLYINGTEHRMEAGDVGLVCAGDQHWIKNIGDSELAYFVVTLGPPE